MQALNVAVEYSTSNMDAGRGIYNVLSINFKAGIAVLGPGNAQVIGIEQYRTSYLIQTASTLPLTWASGLLTT
jgi:hypothetical protein